MATTRPTSSNNPGLVDRLRNQPVIVVLIALILVFCVCGAAVFLLRPLLSTLQKPQAILPGRSETPVAPGAAGELSSADQTATAFFAPIFQDTPTVEAPVVQVTPSVEPVSPVQPPATAAPTEAAPPQPPATSAPVPPAVAPQAPPVQVPQPAVSKASGYTPYTFKYRVQYGDNLWSIAWRFCGNPYAWTKIFADNRNKIAHYRLIYAGQKLKISCP